MSLIGSSSTGLVLDQISLVCNNLCNKNKYLSIHHKYDTKVIYIYIYVYILICNIVIK